MRLRDLEAQSVLRTGERHGAFVVYRDPSQVDDGFLSALLPDPDRLFEAGQAIQSPWQSAATDKTIVEIRGKSYFLKRYNCLGSRYRLKSIVRTSRALKSWWAGWKFLELGLPTPRPVACLEERRFRLLGRSYILFDYWGDSWSLLDLWSELSDVQRAQLLSVLGKELGKMHRQGVLHGDSNWRNILVSRVGTDVKISLIDLDGSRFLRKLSRERAMRDLAHFLRDLSRSGAPDELRAHFIDCWLKASGF